MRVQSGSTDQVMSFVAVDATDLVTRETGLTGFTVARQRKGGTATAWTTPTVTEASASLMPGVYGLLLDEDTTIGAGDDEQQVVLHITHASMAPVTITYELFRPKYAAGSTMPTITGDAYARLGAPAGASVSADVAAVKTQTAAIETDTQDIQSRLPAALVSGRIDSYTGAMGNNVVTAAAAASDLTTELQSGLATAAALSTLAGYVDTEVAAIKAVTDKLDTTMEADGGVQRFTANALEQAPSGTGASAASIAEALFTYDTGETESSAVPGSVVYEIVQNAGTGSAPTAEEIADEVQTRTIAAVTTVNGLGSNVVNANALATDAVAEIQSGLATASGLSAAVSTLQSDIGDVPTAAANADALLGRNLAGGSDGGRTVKQALYALRNRWTNIGGTYSVYEINDTTVSWTSAIGTDAGAEPIVGSDPA